MFPSLLEGGSRLIPTEELEGAFTLQWTATTGIEGFGAGQATATPLMPGLNEITSVPAPSSSVRLPPASIPGQMILVINTGGGNQASIWANTGDSVIGITANGTVSLVPGVSIPVGRRETFVCIRPGYWVMFLWM
jgi:hypothetical protein